MSTAERPRGVSIAAFGMVYQQALSFVSGLVIARVIGAADYGIFNLARNILLVVGIYTRLGLDVGLQRFIGEAGQGTQEQEARLTLSRYFRLATFAASLLPIAAVGLGLGDWVEATVYRYEGFSRVLLVTLLALPFLSDLAVLGGQLRGTLNPAPSVLAEYVVMPTVRLVAIVLLFALGYRLWAVVLGTSGATVVAAVFLHRRALAAIPAAFSRLPGASPASGEVGKVISYSLVIAAAMSVTTLTRTVDTFFLGRFCSARDLGEYSLSQMMLLLVGLFGSALGQSLGGQIAHRYAQRDMQGMESLLAENVRWIALVSCPLFAVFYFWGADLAMVFGASYRISAGVIRWLAATSLVATLTACAGFTLSMTGRQGLELRILLSGLVATLGFCWLGVPDWGQLGAACAVFSAILLTNIARLWFVWREFRIFHLRLSLLGIFATAMLCGLASSVFAGGAGLERILRAVAGSTASVIAYAFFAWFLLFTEAEKQALRQRALQRISKS